MDEMDRIISVVENAFRCHRELRSMVDKNTACIEELKNQSNIRVVSKGEFAHGLRKSLKKCREKIAILEKDAEGLRNQVINRGALVDDYRKMLAEHKEKIKGLEREKEEFNKAIEFQNHIIRSFPNPRG